MANENADWPMQVFYDGACPLCSREMAAYRQKDVHRRIEFVDIANPNFDAARHGFDLQQLNQAMHVKTATGQIFTAVHAFIKIWEAIPSFWTRLLRFLLKIPGVMFVAGLFYRWFARNRYRLTGRCTPESCSVNTKTSESV